MGALRPIRLKSFIQIPKKNYLTDILHTVYVALSHRPFHLSEKTKKLQVDRLRGRIMYTTCMWETIAR